MFEHSGRVETGDGEVRDGLDGIDSVGLRKRMSNLADFPGGSSGAETIDDHTDVLHPFAGNGERIGQGGEYDHGRGMLIVMHDRNIQGAF